MILLDSTSKCSLCHRLGQWGFEMRQLAIERQRCAIWDTRVFSIQPVPERDAVLIDSPRAGGAYVITRRAEINLWNAGDSERLALTSWLIDQRLSGNKTPNITESDLDNIIAAPQKTVSERRDLLLLYILSSSRHIGDTIQIRRNESEDGGLFEKEKYTDTNYFLLAWTESLSIHEVIWLSDFCINQGLLTSEGGNIELSFSGYAHIEDSQKTRRLTEQAFVAMWFSPEVAGAYEHGISPAIIDSGYKPVRIDQVEHINKIDDAIVSEIRRSRFVVADFTCGTVNAGGADVSVPRGGVYYEAGFAQGLGIPVIWCCREDQIGSVHFDTRQFNHITWKAPEDLRRRLTQRIGAVLGDGPLLNRRNH